jgi:hypothetical protein
MRSSNKSRSRNKNVNNSNRRGGNTGNIVNRVFDSAGPEGKVRGTPQQIIEKYQSLSHDAQMAGDRIASENFAQYAEHYTRLLGSAQREIAERRDQMEAQRRDAEAKEAEAAAKSAAKEARNDTRADSDQPDVSNIAGGDLFPASNEDESNLVQTPENSVPKPAKKAAPRKRKPVQKPAASEAQPASSEEPVIN